jgi:hypothetical protein
MLLALGIGMSLSNARAVLEGLLGKETSFVRTPKYRIESSADGWKEKKYRGLGGSLPWIEVALGLLVLFQAGFLYTGVLSLLESIELKAFREGSKAWQALRLTG